MQTLHLHFLALHAERPSDVQGVGESRIKLGFGEARESKVLVIMIIGERAEKTIPSTSKTANRDWRRQIIGGFRCLLKLELPKPSEHEPISQRIAKT